MKAITRDELKKMNETDARDFVLINVLAPEHFNQQHIRTSVNVPVQSDDFVSQVERIAGDKNRDVVVDCASFDCDASPRAADKLDQAGFPHVFDYEGGTKDWFEQKQQA